MTSAKAYQTILKQLGKLNKADLAALQEDIAAMLPTAPEPSAEEALLPPGHHLEEKRFTNKDGSHRTYTHERWYERNGRNYVHRSKAVHKGSKAAYLAHLTGKG